MEIREATSLRGFEEARMPTDKDLKALYKSKNTKVIHINIALCLIQPDIYV